MSQGVFALILAVLAFPVAADAEDGRRLYEEGVLPSGRPLKAESSGGTRLEGRAAACVNCHRRSGQGGTEGRSHVPPVTGTVLFSPQEDGQGLRHTQSAVPVVPLRHRLRQPYDEPTLARSLRDGVDSSGRKLDPLMPRYDLDEAALAAVTAHLRHLGEPAPGVEPSALHLATIVTPDAPPDAAMAVAETVQGYVRQRRDARPWRVHLWKLEGPPAGWTAQLEEHYRRQPVFAVLSGAGGAHWEPVHRFCDARRLPCILPLVELAPEGGERSYSLYFSPGVGLEARILARYFAAEAIDPAQVFSGPAGEAAAGMLSRELGSGAGAPLEAGELPAGNDALVLWLRPAELGPALAELDSRGYGGKVFVSAQLAPPEEVMVPEGLRGQVRFVSVFEQPQRRRAREALGLRPWLERSGVATAGGRWQSEAYAASYFFADALAQMRGVLDRDYLLETLERTVSDKPAGAPYLRLSLGPGQRYAAKGGVILRYADTAPSMVALGPLIVP